MPRGRRAGSAWLERAAALAVAAAIVVGPGGVAAASDAPSFTGFDLVGSHEDIGVEWITVFAPRRDDGVGLRLAYGLGYGFGAGQQMDASVGLGYSWADGSTRVMLLVVPALQVRWDVEPPGRLGVGPGLDITEGTFRIGFDVRFALTGGPIAWGARLGFGL